MSAARFIVSGKVQGVFFRASARDHALKLGLRGYAKNLADGRVEVLAAGDDAALDALTAWLREGPPMARVDVVAEGSTEALDALEAWLQAGPPAARVDAVVRTPWHDAVNEGFVTG